MLNCVNEIRDVQFFVLSIEVSVWSKSSFGITMATQDTQPMSDGKVSSNLK